MKKHEDCYIYVTVLLPISVTHRSGQGSCILFFVLELAFCSLWVQPFIGFTISELSFYALEVIKFNAIDGAY
jgi:hypothetical protein